MAVYKCFKSDFNTLQKKVNRITKKLDKNGLKWKFEIVSESIEEVDVIDHTNYDNVPMWQFQPKNLGKKAVDVVIYEFEMETLKLGEYEPIAVIDHKAIVINSSHSDNFNMIHTIKDGAIIPLKYREIGSHCEHCNSNRFRNTTILLQDEKGNIKQVGTTCIKEFTGIEGIDIIKNYQHIHDIILSNNVNFIHADKFTNKYISTTSYLTACIELIEEKGYQKNITKIEGWKNATDGNYKDSHQKTALEVIEYFKNKEFNDNFMYDVKVALSSAHSKQSGFIAYAYIAYQKDKKRELKSQDELQQKSKSQHYGEIGQKIEIELTLKKCLSFENSYNGYSSEISYIYLFEDEEGNIYKWSTGKFLERVENDNCIPINANESLKIKGTIKDHTNYNGENQTVITRCKVM